MVTKKQLSLIFTTLSALIILDSLNAGQALVMFMIAGVIPGTSLALDATVTLQFFAALIGFTLARASSQLVKYSLPTTSSLAK